jgi:phage repressor protein C with HTH and peptisase S24 domain
MGWADKHIKELAEGKVVQFRPKGNSMTGRINDGQLVTVSPNVYPAVGDAVLCKVNGNVYVHLVKAIDSDGRFQIGNNKGHINGWTKTIYGLVTKVED